MGSRWLLLEERRRIPENPSPIFFQKRTILKFLNNDSACRRNLKEFQTVSRNPKKINNAITPYNLIEHINLTCVPKRIQKNPK